MNKLTQKDATALMSMAGLLYSLDIVEIEDFMDVMAEVDFDVYQPDEDDYLAQLLGFLHMDDV